MVIKTIFSIKPSCTIIVFKNNNILNTNNRNIFKAYVGGK